MRAINEDTNDSWGRQISQVENLKYCNQQIAELGRSRAKLTPEEPVYCIRPGEA
jgi:hypothetical protein